MNLKMRSYEAGTVDLKKASNMKQRYNVRTEPPAEQPKN